MRCLNLHICTLGSLLAVVASNAASLECGADPTTLLQSRVSVGLEEESHPPSDAYRSEANINPPKFVFVSSTAEKKIIYTVRQDLVPGETTPFTLIDHGLKSPKSLAFDQNNGFLYIADSGAEKIFRHTVILDSTGHGLTTTHFQLTVVKNCGPVEWITLDDAGNLFYSAPKTNNINKVSAEVLAKLTTGEIQAHSLVVMSQKVVEAQQLATDLKTKIWKSQGNASNALQPTDPPPFAPHILSIYEAKLNPHVAQPGAIWAEGADLFWTNQKDGTTAGTVVQGQANPKVVTTKTGPAPFPAKALTKISSGAVGLAKANGVIFFSHKEALGGATAVTGLVVGTDVVLKFVSSLGSARSLVSDRERTMYVADEIHGKVWQFPTGRVMANAPLSLTVSVKGAFGLAFASSAAPCFTDASRTFITSPASLKATTGQ